MTAPRVGLALIARDESDNLPRLLRSVQGAFDRVVLVDTGSTDNTIDLFEEWAAEHVPGAWAVSRIDWHDDFAAARETADRLLLEDPSIEWRAWADCDDTIEGAANIRGLCARAPDGAGALMATYDYAHAPDGTVICQLRRERVIRRGEGRWAGRVHEALLLDMPVVTIPPETLRWVHHRTAPPSGRNVRILRAWNREEPDNPRVLQYLGTEYLAKGDHGRAIGYFRRYLKQTGTWDQERAQVHRRLSLALLAKGRVDDAQRVALDALAVLPEWPDSYITMASITHDRGEWEKCVQWCDRVIALGPPDTMLIINPVEYVAWPRGIKASALASLGDLDGAIALGEEAARVAPDAALHDGLARWRAARKRRSTIGAVLGLVELLHTHDENLKAAAVLDQCVPYYVADAPEIVQARVDMRSLVGHATDPDGYTAHYEESTEGGVNDEDIALVALRTPRVGFLVEGLRDQAGGEPGWINVRTGHGDFKTRAGDMMAVYLTRDPDGYEPELERVIRANTRAGDTVLNVGANIGYFTRHLVNLAGPDGRVIAVEPDPDNAHWLAVNVPQANVIEAAAGATNGQVVLHRHPVNSGDNRVFEAPGTTDTVEVPMWRADNILADTGAERVDVVVVDAQGTDHRVVEGLGYHRPRVIIVEHWPEGIEWAGDTVQDALDVYARMGYHAEPVGDTTEGHWNLLLTHQGAAS